MLVDKGMHMVLSAARTPPWVCCVVKNSRFTCTFCDSQTSRRLTRCAAQEDLRAEIGLL